MAENEQKYRNSSKNHPDKKPLLESEKTRI